MAGKGGGAWKVAYADFVTAMMAFFLVMWICAQDQRVREEVAHYFSAPVHFFKDPVGQTKRPEKTGSLFDSPTTGSVPQSERVALGQGRHSHSTATLTSRATKLVGDWVFFSDSEDAKKWREKAAEIRNSPSYGKGSRDKPGVTEEEAALQLARQMKEAFTRGVSARDDGPQRDLLYEIMGDVNWQELAEDLLRTEPHFKNAPQGKGDGKTKPGR